MRLAYVSTDPGIPTWGSKGASIHVQEMLRALLGLGAHATLLTPRPGGEPPVDLARVATHRLALAEGTAEGRAASLLALNDDLRMRLDALGPLDLVYERHALFAHGAMEWARARGVPSVLEVNAPLIEEQARHRTLVLAEEADASARRAFAAASVVVAVSREVAAYVVALGADPARVAVIPNGVNPARFPPRPAPEGPFTVGFLGTLKPWHDTATLVEALPHLRAEIPDARLLIVGDGPERPRIEARLAELSLTEAVTFTGALAADRVPEALAAMHVAVAPYRAQGSFYFSPLKIYEYMAASLPVVASRVGHLDEVVTEGRTGLLVPPDDSSALAAELGRLAVDPDLCRRMGTEGRAEVLARHTWTGAASRVLSLAGLGARQAA
jgi:glycosyltransferase involved in cell wall biosynthesis